MTSEEMNRTMEFIVQQNAQFAVNMEQLFRSLNDLKEQTARFETWASEVVAIQSRRLDQNEARIEQERKENERRWNAHWKEQEQSRREMMRLLNMILDRLPPFNNN
jgi:hypothetical protein